MIYVSFSENKLVIRNYNVIVCTVQKETWTVCTGHSILLCFILTLWLEREGEGKRKGGGEERADKKERERERGGGNRILLLYTPQSNSIFLSLSMSLFFSQVKTKLVQQLSKVWSKMGRPGSVSGEESRKVIPMKEMEMVPNKKKLSIRMREIHYVSKNYSNKAGT